MRIYNNPISVNEIRLRKKTDITDEDRNTAVKLGWCQEDQKYLICSLDEIERKENRKMNPRTLRQIEHSKYVSRNRTVNRIYEITRSNLWEYFITLTFSPKKVKSRYDYNELSKKVSKWLDHLHRIAPKIRYMVVPELHKDGAYHFHGLIADTGDMCIIDSGTKDTQGRKIYNLLDFRYGWNTATPVSDNTAVSSYITKYITKDLVTVTANKKRYWASRNLDKLETVEYNLPREEIEEILDSLSENISHMKTLEIPCAGRKITYVEISD